MMEHGDSRTHRSAFDVRQLDYGLPRALIAQEPSTDRGASRLLVVSRKSGWLRDGHVNDLPYLLSAGDVLVINDTRVIRAKFRLVRQTGGRIDGLFLRDYGGGEWEVLLNDAGRLQIGELLHFDGPSDESCVRPVHRGERGHWRIRVECARPAARILEEVGRMPLPPYIQRGKSGDHRDALDRERYQTVFARRDGAIAAPTAGLHLTNAMLNRLGTSGISIEHVTLHVGYGTFAPIEVDDLAEHPMHTEYFELDADTAARLSRARVAGGRVVAVGTTSARVLETTWKQMHWSGGMKGWTDLFCYPPYGFEGVDVLLTNFHLPRSTLLALVMAFAGPDLIRRAYLHAVQSRYRFYSYGDAMLIL